MNGNARRHGRTKARGRGFSLIEVLLAIFILGIGIISIAALFPAGIAQQQQSYDDIMGPLVAQNAMSILRSKLRQEDFGFFEQRGVDPPRYTVEGDWTWLRPGVIFDPAYPGAIDIFSAKYTDGTVSNAANEFPSGYNGANPRLHGIPHDSTIYPGDPPAVLVSQRERYFPVPTYSDLEADGSLKPSFRPQFYWECLFRRFQGRIQVAIFVFRVAPAGGRPIRYSISPNPSEPDIPPLPIWLQLGDVDAPDGAWDASGPDGDLTTTLDNAIVCGTELYDPFNDSQSWQEPRQRILDQNGNLHRVLARYPATDDTSPCDTWVELVRPVPPTPPLPPYYWLPPQGGIAGVENVVSDIWYLPRFIDADADGDPELSVTPVFLTVQEL